MTLEGGSLRKDLDIRPSKLLKGQILAGGSSQAENSEFLSFLASPTPPPAPFSASSLFYFLKSYILV